MCGNMFITNLPLLCEVDGVCVYVCVCLCVCVYVCVCVCVLFICGIYLRGITNVT